jgi:hypothetical protein
MSLEAMTRKGRGIIDPLITMIYFVPEGPEQYTKLGLDGPRESSQAYFCTRGAPLGKSGELVASTFYNFNPAGVVPLVNAGWQKTTPEAAIAARNQAVIAALSRLLAGEDNVTLPDVTREIELVKKATTNLKYEGRPLFTAHYAQPWPEEHPLLSLWWGLNLMREFRGDGHIAALVTAEISGIESSLISGPWQNNPKYTSFMIKSRLWSETEIAAAYEGLAERDILRDGELTTKGRALRDEIEATTDRLDLAPWRNVGDDLEEFLTRLQTLGAVLATRYRR